MDYNFLGSKLTCSISYWSTQRGCWATSPARRRPSGLLRRRPATSKSGSRNSGGRGRGQEAAAGADADLEEDAVWGPGGWRSTRWALGEGRGGEGGRRGGAGEEDARRRGGGAIEPRSCGGWPREIARGLASAAAAAGVGNGVRVGFEEIAPLPLSLNPSLKLVWICLWYNGWKNLSLHVLYGSSRVKSLYFYYRVSGL